MRLVIILLLFLGIPAVFAKGQDDKAVTPDWKGVGANEDISPVLPDVDDFESQKNYEEEAPSSYSRWDNSNFRLYNPEFDDNSVDSKDKRNN